MNSERHLQPTIKEAIKMAEKNETVANIKKFVENKHNPKETRYILAAFADHMIGQFKK